MFAGAGLLGNREAFLLWICLDANVIIAALAAPGSASGRVMRNVARGRLRVVTSLPIQREYVEQVFARWVARIFYRRGAQASDFLDALGRLFSGELVFPEGAPPLCRDESDRKYLHCALAGQVDYLITQDNDLLVLEQIAGIPIMRPATFLALAEEAGWLLDP